MEAYALRAQLEDAGISSVVDSELLQGIVGEVPGGWVTAPRLLVPADQLVAARAVLAEFLNRSAKVNDIVLKCLDCGAAMGDRESCLTCGWTYASTTEPSITPAPVVTATVDPTSSEVSNAQGSSPHPVASAYSAGWGEVCAVLAVGVIPHLFSVVQVYFQSKAPLAPYWLDSLALAGLSACTVYVTLYLIRRSGQPWNQFGLGLPQTSDLFLGFGALIVAEAILWFEFRLGVLGGSSPAEPPSPRESLDYAIMFPKIAIAAFAEELVTRCYLITRLEQLLRSQWRAVLFAAIAFASYHIGWGLGGAIYALAFGLAYGIIYLANRRVWPLVVGHTLYNLHGELSN
jgi:membrane protease YdiL (CAAX protease family)